MSLSKPEACFAEGLFSPASDFNMKPAVMGNQATLSREEEVR